MDAVVAVGHADRSGRSVDFVVRPVVFHLFSSIMGMGRYRFGHLAPGPTSYLLPLLHTNLPPTFNCFTLIQRFPVCASIAQQNFRFVTFQSCWKGEEVATRAWELDLDDSVIIRRSDSI